jgi:Fur family transcriptional regulator, ferric uptake regulator
VAPTAANQKLPGNEKVPGSVRVEQVVELLRASGSRITTSRRILLRCLFDGAPHRSAEEIASEVQAIAPDVHISTVYRNLYELERLGVVVHAHLGHGPAIYHLATETHGHLVCEVCGAMVEAPGDFFEGLAKAADTRYGFSIDPRHFAVLGQCRSCAKARDEGP